MSIDPNIESELAEAVRRSDMTDDTKRVFSIRFVLAIVVNVAIATFFLSNVINKLDKNCDMTREIKLKQEEDSKDNKQWHSLMEADIAMLKVRVAILESKLEEKNPTEKNLY